MRGPLAFLLVATLLTGACHNVGDVKVLSLSFTGTKSFDSGALAGVLATRKSGWLPWSPKHYFDRAEFESDLKRIVAFYSDRGFPSARVTNIDVTFNAKKDGVHVTIAIDEGAPVLVEAVNFEGFDRLPADGKSALDSLPLKQGGRRDRDLVRATRDQAARLFRDRGYPLAVVDASERPGANANLVIVTYRADPGAQMNFGNVAVTGLETLQEKNIIRELAFKPGQLFDERLIARSQRKLSRLELLEVAVVTPRLDAADGKSVPVAVTVTEGPPRLLRLGIGYGSEELARGTLTWQHLNFHGGAKQATVDAKYSAIERGIDLGLIDPYAWRSGLSSRIGATAWRTQQLTYDSERYGGSYGLTYQTERASSSAHPPIRYRAQATYAYQRIRFGITQEFLADQSRRDERIALGFDPDTGRASGGLATIELSLERQALDNAANPRRGTMSSAQFEFASHSLGGTYNYIEIGGEGRGFLPLGPMVFGVRAQAGTIASRNVSLVPFSKRYFLGGSAHLRGWSRFEVSPLDDEGRPIGGRTVLDLSAELRVPLPRPASLGLVGFVDGGNVWAGGFEIKPRDLRWAAGIGLRYLTPVGAIRIDLARQLTPIPNLLINGAPSTKRWRLHFNLGHTF
ncbi:MAG TPA: BamA/TamA family outer membrane protein [Vicinamibacterales bacterium]|nr:BamA/TamA family outer membrane protein [Vicinamibacterales bacterium]